MSSNPSPALAAAISLIFPGLGQIYAGAVRRGIVWALPTIALVLFIVFVVVTKTSLFGLVTSEATLAIIALEFAFLFYHLAAMIDAYGIASRGRRRTGAGTTGAAAGALIGLLVIAVLLHGYPLYLSVIGNNFLSGMLPGRSILPTQSFVTEPPMSIPPEVTDSPEPGQTATPSGQPTPTGEQTPTPPPTSLPPLQLPATGIWKDVSDNDRLNILLIGTDAGPDRPGGRTDTMILLSIQVSTGKAAMFGFPRNMTNVPIEDAGGTLTFNRFWTDPFPPGNGDPNQSLLTNMWQYAYDHPDKFFTPPDACAANDPNFATCQSQARAYRATEGAIQNMAGVNIQGVIAVNLTAFRELVDTVGGIWMDIPQPIYDDAYPVGEGDTESPKIINIPEGCHWLNGVYALAYARSRHQDSDYQRMKRQQQVLQAVRRQFSPLSMLPQAPQLLQVASDNLWTTFSRDTDVQYLAQIAARVDADRIYTVRITPGQGYPSNLSSDEIKLIRSRVQHIFEQEQPAPDPTPADPNERCPAPGQTPGETYSTDPSPKPK